MTKIEQVARALYKDWYPLDPNLLDWEDMKATFMKSSRAAIEAMREPTEDMRQAAARGVSDSFHEEGFQEGDDPSLWNEFVKAGERAFENVIDAALKETP